MKYKVGDRFNLKTSLGDKETSIVAIKYEFSDYIKGGPKYVSESELQGYINSSVLTKLDGSTKELEIKALEDKYGIKLIEQIKR